MGLNIKAEQLESLGLDSSLAQTLSQKLQQIFNNHDDASKIWQLISKQLLASEYPFNIHVFLFSLLFPNWHDDPESAPAYIPEAQEIQRANITHFMSEISATSEASEKSELSLKDVKSFHHWTIQHIEEFWQRVVDQLQITFDTPYEKISDLTQGVESPSWFAGGTLNIVNSCFHAEGLKPAIIYPDKNKNLITVTYDELNRWSNRVANSLVQLGFLAGDAIGIAMPMNQYAIAIYLGIIKMSGVVVSIADSFSAEEIAARLTIAKAKAIFTQDMIYWTGKTIPLYEKVKKSCELYETKIIVVTTEDSINLSLRDIDYQWENFLVADDQFTAVSCQPMSACNILFSSGTTATPKAIVWNHTTPIKVASDAYFHQNIQPNDVLTWPTNLGWMMGPWLIFAALINKATLALYTDSPKDHAFGEFVQDAHVTMLGVVPTLVAAWKQSHCMEKLDWSAIKIFSSTGECSNPEDMLYLMSLANYKPVIEYCGGTEIGGAYLSSTVVENNYPSLFTTPTMGLNITIMNDYGKPDTVGEVAIIPPSIGLSTSLLNANHEQIYFANMPVLSEGKKLRRHGDQIKQFPQGSFSILGRVDDTMNLGGIKISAAEIERCLTGFADILEVAAIAVSPPNNGPSLLVVYAAATASLDKNSVMREMQKKINAGLNPLFKIHDVIFIADMPKTASNKIMRRELRKRYQSISA